MSHFDSPIELKKLARELSARVPEFASSQVEERLRLSCRARRARRRWTQWSCGIAAVAACLVLFLGWRFQTGRPVQTAQPPLYNGFLALPYAQSDVPIERATVVPVELGPGDLKALGLPPRLISGPQRRRAVLLVGQDGVARAIRLSQ